MTDKDMIELLRDYAKAYMSGKPYNLNHWIALMIANRMEQLVSLVENRESALVEQTENETK